ncbi:unnamed protein product [Urochloa decumbens]|uniref:RING-type E3 ubiquitin transferase n=1 Tax=Urochloa decumbens TaxID=240449 RepID=A0ABC9G847_9POAL
MARPKILESSTHLCLLLVTIFQAATAISYSSYSSLCHFPVPSPDLHTTGNHSRSTATASNNLFLRETSNNLNFPWISTGHFSGGDDLLFVPERSYAVRSFSLIPRHSTLTTDPTVVRLAATLALEGSRVDSRRREFHHSVTFELEGYYSTAATSSAELCMIGSGSYARDDGSDTDVLLSDSVSDCLALRASPSLEGAGFAAIILIAYADDSHFDSDSGYTYAETTASCPPPVTPARDGQHASLRSQGYRDTGDLSDIKYNYTLAEKAKEYYHSNPVLSKDRNGSFPGNHSCRDFAFHFNLKKPEGPGYAWPVTIGSTVVKGDSLMPDDLFSQRVAPEVNTQRLLNVSYDHEGVYDTKTGSLCMVACLVGNGSSDCEVLVTVQFAHVETTEARAHVVGTISSLRRKSDPLFFEALEMESQGSMRPRDESRMNTEIIMLELSPALFAVVLILQLRHAKKHPEGVPSMSITMLAVLALGSLIPLMLDFEPTINANTQYRIASIHCGGGIVSRRIGSRCVPAPCWPSCCSCAFSSWPCRGGDQRNLLVLDGFLLPQVISNVFSGAKARALSPWFYVGGTVIRAAPHAYDVYAGPRGNLSGGVALDVAVLFGMALLGVLLFLQQRVRLQGAFLCSSSKRTSGAYRMISSVP